MRFSKEKIEKIKKAEALFEEAYQKSFFGAINLNISEVGRQVGRPGSVGGFNKDVWGKWKKMKLKQLSKEESSNG